MFEAEEMVESSTGRRPWDDVHHDEAAGSAAIRVQDIGSSLAAESRNIEVEITSPGRYYSWVRALATNGGNNSVHLGIDEQLVGTGDYIKLRRGAQVLLEWTPS